MSRPHATVPYVSMAQGRPEDGAEQRPVLGAGGLGHVARDSEGVGLGLRWVWVGVVGHHLSLVSPGPTQAAFLRHRDRRDATWHARKTPEPRKRALNKDLREHGHWMCPKKTEGW